MGRNPPGVARPAERYRLERLRSEGMLALRVVAAIAAVLLIAGSPASAGLRDDRHFVTADASRTPVNCSQAARNASWTVTSDAAG